MNIHTGCCGGQQLIHYNIHLILYSRCYDKLSSDKLKWGVYIVDAICWCNVYEKWQFLVYVTVIHMQKGEPEFLELHTTPGKLRRAKWKGYKFQFENSSLVYKKMNTQVCTFIIIKLCNWIKTLHWIRCIVIPLL